MLYGGTHPLGLAQIPLLWNFPSSPWMGHHLLFSWILNPSTSLWFDESVKQCCRSKCGRGLCKRLEGAEIIQLYKHFIQYIVRSLTLILHLKQLNLNIINDATDLMFKPKALDVHADGNQPCLWGWSGTPPLVTIVLQGLLCDVLVSLRNRQAQSSYRNSQWRWGDWRLLTQGFSLYLWVFCLCTMCWPGALRGQKKASGLDPLKLELRMDISHHMDARNWTPVLCKSNKGLQPLSHLQPH